jgi:hypothetical protein
MKVSSKIAVSVTALALGASTAAFAVTTPAPDNPGSTHASTTATQAPSTVPPNNRGTANKPSNLPGPNASPSAKGKAYGYLCQGQSKKRSDAAPGTKGTPFSQCVTAMAKAAHTSAPTDTNAQIKSAARSACKAMSHKGAKGQKSPFSLCVTGAAKLLKSQKAQNS